MLESKSSPDFEPHVAPGIVVITLAAAGVALTMAADLHTEPVHRLILLLFTLALYSTAAVGWSLGLWRCEQSKWFLLAALMVFPAAGYILTGFGGFLVLSVVPIVAAVALYGGIVGAATATIQSLVLLGFAYTNNPQAAGPLVIFVLLSNWIVAGLILAMDRTSQNAMGGAWYHFQKMRQELDKNRDRSANLEQAQDDLVHANRQLTLLNERLATTRLIAEEAQKTKSAFVAKVSHEFRTPLNMIIGLTDLLVETPDLYGESLPVALLEDLKIVHRNCAHLSSLIDDVLDLSQTEAGCLVLHREWVDIAANIEDALAVVDPLFQKKNLEVVVDVPDELPRVYCDETRIRQVTLNLISNAARYTDQGKITITARESDHSIQIDIHDTGPGIPPDSLENIFEPFNQGSYGASMGYGGSGLGLSVSKQFIERHNGRIWVESEPGSGSTFSFRLPVSPVRTPIRSAGHWINRDWEWLERTERAPLNRLPQRKRVVVHDPAQRNLVRLEYETEEVEVIGIDDLGQVVEDLQTWPAHAVLLISSNIDDVQSQMLFLRQQLRDTPIVGCCVPDRGEQVVESGASRYLTKPITRNDLHQVLNDLGECVTSVLVVDDDPDVRRLLVRMLQSLDHRLEIATASNGEEALDKMSRNRPDLLLLDIIMPQLDGWGTLRAMKLREQTKAVPTYFISAQDTETGPAAGELLLATVGQGVSVDKLIDCSLTLSAMLSYTVQGPVPGHEQTQNDVRVSTDTKLHPMPAQAPRA